MTNAVVGHFVHTFRGRGDAYGTWEGGARREPLTRRTFEQHLTNGPFIGVYPLVGTRVAWGCVDIDGKDFGHDWDVMWRLADNLTTVLSVKKIYGHQERTANGIHVWVFPSASLVPAAHMRRALMAACTAIGYNPKEVNPKQEDAKGGLGNYVRLPYYGALDNGTPPDRYFVDSNRKALSLESALEAVEAGKTDPSDLAVVAELWSPPERQTFSVNRDIGADIKHLTDLMPGKAWVIWRDGPINGADRSGTLVRLAGILAEEGLPADVIFHLVRTADERWGKYHQRDDCEEQLTRIIERVLP